MDVLASTATHLLLPRQSSSSSNEGIDVGGGDSTGNQFLKIIADPFAQKLESDAIASAFYIFIPITILIFFAFCFLRPYHSVVYAPRAKHADSKHAPPTIGKGLFDWIPAILKTKEQDLVEKVGLDAAVFVRFVRMLRNMFGVLTIVGCGIVIPVNLIGNKDATDVAWSVKITPQPSFGGNNLWAYVVLAYLFDIIICFFLWTNYRAVLRLRRSYFESPDYQRSLHARTLMITDIPSELRSDEGVVRITEQVQNTRDIPRAAVARNVKELPDLVEEHEETVRKLEKVLAKYLKNPDRLPARRPTCKPSKNDRSHVGGEVDAIEYLTARIKELEITIKQVRQTVDMRNALSYGFASYEGIPDAHSVAYAARKSGPHHTTIRLAPKPSDLVWKNLGMSKAARKSKNLTNNMWVGVLTVLWIVPNVLMGAFLSNFSHIGNLSPSFQKSLEAHPTLWAIAQAIVAPAISTLVYYYLPAIFRRMCQNAGDLRKSSREQHVTHKLYAFFVFNNLIVFSIFSAIFGFVAAVIKKNQGGDDAWKAIKEAHIFISLITSLCSISSYWVAWLLQRNLGAAIDLSQVVGLFWGSLVRRFGSPTPRETIELTAPQPFEYASYYNYFLFYATVAVVFAPLQPLVLPVVAFYFWMDSYLKKYLLLYIFITKYESGGMFWRSLFNRMLFCAFLGNVIIALLIVAKTTYGSPTPNWGMLAALVPLLFLIGGFKWYCMRSFDDKIHFYQTKQTMGGMEGAAGVEGKRRKGDRVGVRFGHPVMFKPLITPMVSAKSQHMLKSIYSGRTSTDAPEGYHQGYGDVYMDAMDTQHPGKSSSGPAAPFEIVGENEMDFEHYKNRPEFRDEAGGDGQLFGRSQDQVRSNSPHSMMSLGRTGTSDSFSTLGNAHGHSRSISDPRDPYHAYNSRSGSASREHSTDRAGAIAGGMEYPRGYHPAPSSGLRDHSPAPSDYREDLVGHAAGMGRSTPPGVARKPLSLGLGGLNAREQFGPGPQGYGMVPGAPIPGHGTPYGNTPYGGTPGDEDAGSYEYFRRGRGL